MLTALHNPAPSEELSDFLDPALSLAANGKYLYQFARNRLLDQYNSCRLSLESNLNLGQPNNKAYLLKSLLRRVCKGKLEVYIPLEANRSMELPDLQFLHDIPYHQDKSEVDGFSATLYKFSHPKAFLDSYFDSVV